MFSIRGGWCPVSHDVQGVLGLCVLRTVGNKVLLSICCIELHCMSDVGDCNFSQPCLVLRALKLHYIFGVGDCIALNRS